MSAAPAILKGAAINSAEAASPPRPKIARFMVAPVQYSQFPISYVTFA
jgi:hypothetical protein